MTKHEIDIDLPADVAARYRPVAYRRVQKGERYFDDCFAEVRDHQHSDRTMHRFIILAPIADAQQSVVESQKNVAVMQDDLQRMVARVKRYEKALRYIAFCCENDCDSEEPRDKAMTDMMDKARKAFLGG